ncbi:hypothetical protein [Pararhodobacter aggregans]
MTNFLPDHRYYRLVENLMEGFVRAASSPMTDMRNETINALATADIMPSCARGDFERDAGDTTGAVQRTSPPDLVTLPMTVRRYQAFIAEVHEGVTDALTETMPTLSLPGHVLGAEDVEKVEIWDLGSGRLIVAMHQVKSPGVVNVITRRPTPGIYRTVDIMLHEMRDGEAM